MVSAGLLPEKSSLEEFDSHPSYKFNYNVDDPVTGDVKAQHETRDGDFVQGQYSLNDADGYKRTVDYTSDAVSGFKAVVRREPLNAAQVIVQQPIVKSAEAVAPVKLQQQAIVKPQTVFKSFVQTPTVIRTYSAPTTLVHHQPTVYHQAPHTVHLTSSSHLVHSSPSATLVKTAPSFITTHHHTPAVVHHSPTVVHHAPTVLHHAPTVVKSSIATPHQVSYVHYH